VLRRLHHSHDLDMAVGKLDGEGWIELDVASVSMCEHHVNGQKNSKLQESQSIGSDYNSGKAYEETEIKGG
jgi:hypothetical protein